MTSIVALARRPPPLPRARAERPSIPDVLPPETKVGQWRIDRMIGRGGMAAVYAVVHTGFGKRAALKLAHRTNIGPALADDAFLREARTVNTIDHPATTDVFATGRFYGRPYLVMERLSGSTLAHRLRTESLSRDEALAILLALCDVLGAAHAAGIVHRDLKLDNVFLLDPPRVGIKLLDWGFARHVYEEDPLRGMLAGTLTYAAPEQFRGEDITPATDVYALGVLAYQLLLGAPPFSAADNVSWMRMHLDAAPPPPASIAPDVARDLDDLLLRMLAKRAAERPSAAEVAKTLTAAKRRRTRLSTALRFTWLGRRLRAAR
jgi:serine/threonine-protein kinase